MEPLIHAIVGCGRVAPNHVDGIRAVAGAQVRWACDRDRRVAQAFAAAHGIPAACDSVDEVLSDPQVTSVSIAVDHAQHAELVARALMAGKHVLVEKPIALDITAARELSTIAQVQRLLLSVVSQHRYDPLVTAVRGWIRDGLLGRVAMCTIALQCQRDYDYYQNSYWRGTWNGEGGSALINQGYHCLDVAQWLCGPLTVRGAAWSNTALSGVMETDGTLGAVMTGGDGLVATLAVTVSSSDLWRSRLCVVGEAGTVEFDLDHPNRLHRCSGNAKLEQMGASLGEPNEPEPPPGVGYYGISHRRQIADFCRSIKDGVPMLARVDDAIDTLALIQSVYRSAAAEPRTS